MLPILETETMKTNGLSINAQAIGDGIYKMICERDEAGIVAFGMIPLWSMECLRKLLREKVVTEAAKSISCTPKELAPYVSQEKLNATVSQIEREVATAIYRAASNADAMLV